MNQGPFIAGIVGGGNGGSEILRLFGQSPLLKIAFVCDLNHGAVAMVAAREQGIATYTSLESALQMPVQFVFEATGSKRVLQELRKLTGENAHIIEHETAHFFFRVLFDVTASTNARVIDDIRQIGNGITGSASRINDQMRAIRTITLGLHMVGLNARVEAARIGGTGAGFDVVAQEVQKSAQTVRSISEEITDISQSIVSLSTMVDSSIERLSNRSWDGSA